MRDKQTDGGHADGQKKGSKKFSVRHFTGSHYTELALPGSNGDICPASAREYQCK
jgi:hypothetical protein